MMCASRKNFGSVQAHFGFDRFGTFQTKDIEEYPANRFGRRGCYCICASGQVGQALVKMVITGTMRSVIIAIWILIFWIFFLLYYILGIGMIIGGSIT